MLQRWKKNSKKGFTLVELIVVLVILAILAALLIPALTGYIDKAKEKQIIAETRQVVMAAQTLVDEVYGTISLSDVDSAEIKIVDTEPANDLEIKKEEVATLAEVPVGNITSVKVNESSNMPGVVTSVTYEKDNKICTYTKTDVNVAGTYEITEQPAP